MTKQQITARVLVVSLSSAIGVPTAAQEAAVAPAPEAAVEQLAAVTTSENNALISVDFKDADIRQVLRILALKSGIDIVAGNDIEDKTVKVQHVAPGTIHHRGCVNGGGVERSSGSVIIAWVQEVVEAVHRDRVTAQ